ncbi:hypothetical protein [Streptomyces abyssomicinicus]|uniref:hypothetical protein n=1 Tax=Streptomyces abyssomicinicus TaxID=574929 RepID=UPI00124FCDF3|nr:hypothetical protein [Streptomyces abyssomicinicus]
MGRPSADRAAGRGREWALGVVVAVVMPLSVVAVEAGFLLLRAHVPGGLLWAVLGFAAAFGLLGFFFLNGHMPFVSSALVLWSLGLVAAGFGDLLLENRGREVTCTVLAKDTRVETTTSTDANGFTSTTTTTYYDLALGCPGDGPRKMSTTEDTGREGRTLRVSYDPDGRLPPQPASSTDHRELWTAGWLIAAAVVVGVGLRLLPGARRPGRPPRLRRL